MSTETPAICDSPREGEKATGMYRGMDYEEVFDVRGYLRTRFGQGVENPNNAQPVAFQSQTFHNFYTKFHTNWDETSARLLEFGGGPTIYPLISACPYVKEIVFVDYMEPCLNEVRLWKDQDPSAHNWGPFFQYIVNQLEGKEEKDAVAHREKELREKIVSIEQCDITKPVQSVIDPKLGVFDIVSTSGCLECMAETKEEFTDFLKKMAFLTKPGGYFVTLVSIEMSRYCHLGINFKCLSLSQEDMRSSLETAGFTVEMVQYSPFDPHRRVINQSDCVGKATFVAKKL